MEEENKELEKYNSEDIERLKAAFIGVLETVKEAVKPVIETVVKVAKELHRGLMIAFNTDPEIKRCYGIYKRTKNRRIRKKQLTRISKIIKRRYIENGNMDKDADKK